MASSLSKKICIPFRPLLVQITDCLDFPRPSYSVVDVSKCSSCVYIRTEGHRGIFWFNGGEAASVGDSQEVAAQKAVNFLIKKYGVCVEDLTMDRMRKYEFCGKLYRLKRNSMEPGDKRLSVSKKVVGEVVHVSLDYVGCLIKVIKETGVLVTSLETMHSVGQGYISWLTVACPHTKTRMECIFSNMCSDSDKSKQMAAKKTIYYIMHQYNLDIVDANYGSANVQGVLCSLERESCISLEERKKGQKDNAALLPFLAEDISVTPPRDDCQTVVTIDSPRTPAPSVSKRPLGTPCTPDIGTSNPCAAAKRVRFA